MNAVRWLVLLCLLVWNVHGRAFYWRHHYLANKKVLTMLHHNKFEIISSPANTDAADVFAPEKSITKIRRNSKRLMGIRRSFAHIGLGK
ncbi:hypothetical protein QR680_010055 [Steinernema hermaphroditum]|uniref:Uncharacterized protein n=1 Tax=Steinernema hermaphroditum TaxID=289476 RepID=A0AA39IMK6_9BILA|nr:hypothetical protein QR680_010055 [Steinernema hermaphroditum]